MTRPSWERRLLAFDQTLAFAFRPKDEPLAGEPLAFEMPLELDVEERVCLGLTSFGQVQFLSAVSLLQMVKVDPALTGPLYGEGPLVHANRCRVVQEFLADEALGAWLLFVDGDVVAEPSIARRLVTVAKQLRLHVLSQCYPGLAGGGEAGMFIGPSGRVSDIAPPPWGQVMACDAVGFGCVIVSRELLVRMSDEYSDEGRDALFCPAPDHPAWGEDFCFCFRARSVDARIATSNIGRVWHLKVVPLGLPSQAALPAIGGAV